MTSVPTSSITIPAARFRKDMGDIDGLAKSIAEIGLLQPIVITAHNELIAGERRLRAVELLGWESIPARIINLDAILIGEFAENTIRKDFTITERVAIGRAVEAELGERQGQRTDLGLVDHGPQVEPGEKTRDIAAERAGFESGKQYERAKQIVDEGSSQLVESVERGEVSVSAAAQIAKLDKEEQTAVVEAGPQAAKDVAKDIRENGIVNRTSFTGNNQWFTPQQYIDLAREVLGDFDLDPATHAIAQERVKANTFYTEDDDGLSKEWNGRVWLNPPYAQPAIGLFVDKLVAEVQSGRVTSAIMLTHNYTDTAWFQKAAQSCRAICFTRGRVRFVSPSGELAAPTQGQAFFYFGENVTTFSAHFEEVGFVVSRV